MANDANLIARNEVANEQEDGRGNSRSWVSFPKEMANDVNDIGESKIKLKMRSGKWATANRKRNVFDI